MKNHFQQMKFLEKLESIRHMLRPHNYRSAMADSLIYYFSFEYKSPTKVCKQTNKFLKYYGVESISLGYTRTVLGRR